MLTIPRRKLTTHFRQLGQSLRLDLNQLSGSVALCACLPPSNTTCRCPLLCFLLQTSCSRDLQRPSVPSTPSLEETAIFLLCSPDIRSLNVVLGQGNQDGFVFGACLQYCPSGQYSRSAHHTRAQTTAREGQRRLESGHYEEDFDNHDKRRPNAIATHAHHTLCYALKEQASEEAALPLLRNLPKTRCYGEIEAGDDFSLVSPQISINS